MTPDWLQPMPWLQMQQREGNNPSTAEGIASAIGSLAPALMNRGEGKGIGPPPRRYKTLNQQQIARKAGDYANSVMGEPPPMY